MTLLLALLTLTTADATPMFGYGADARSAVPARCTYCSTNRTPEDQAATTDGRLRNTWAGPRYFPQPQVVVVEVPVMVKPPAPPPEPTAWQLRTKIEPGELILLAELKNEMTPLNELEDAFMPLVAE